MGGVVQRLIATSRDKHASAEAVKARPQWKKLTKQILLFVN